MENEEAVLMGIYHTRRCRGANGHKTKIGKSIAYTPGWHVERKPARPRIESEDPRREQEMSFGSCKGAISSIICGLSYSSRHRVHLMHSTAHTL